MGDGNSLEHAGNRPIASTLTSLLMPEADVSERTQTSYDIGAQMMLEHLMGGEWDVVLKEYETSFLREFVGRVISNAQRQGIDVSLNQATAV